tara:strand:+ start:4312 stop:5235 length:924 start_codon:yes stop_codon:yes gene_type:complete
MGKAKRFNSYDQAVQDQRNIVQNYGQGRQGLSGIRSSFRTAPPSPISDFDPNREENISTAGDNLGNHTATQDLNLAGNDIILSTDGDTKFNVVGATLLFQCSNSGSSTEVFRISATELQMAKDIDVNDNDIKDIQRAMFDVDGDTFIAGEHYSSIADDTLEFYTGDSLRFKIDNTTTTATGQFSAYGNTILGLSSSETLAINGRLTTSLIPNSDNSVDLGSSSNEWRHLYVDGTANLDTISAGATTTNTLFTTSTTSLGDGDTDQVNFYGMTDWKTNTTASSASTGNREGYITIKINGTEKKLYYYA